MNITMQVSQETLALWGAGTGLVLIAYTIGYIRGQLKDWEKWRDWACKPYNAAQPLFMAAAIILGIAGTVGVITAAIRVCGVRPYVPPEERMLQMKLDNELKLKEIELRLREARAQPPQPQPPQPQQQPPQVHVEWYPSREAYEAAMKQNPNEPK